MIVHFSGGKILKGGYWWDVADKILEKSSWWDCAKIWRGIVNVIVDRIWRGKILEEIVDEIVSGGKKFVGNFLVIGWGKWGKEKLKWEKNKQKERREEEMFFIFHFLTHLLCNQTSHKVWESVVT